MKHIATALINWFDENKRDLPWRQSTDPYTVWLSEVVLQQTKVKQGLPYFKRFLQNYPTVRHLAATSSDKLFKLSQGLGYYRRAENLMKTANIIVNEYDGKFPRKAEELKKLPGIGDYTAAAIASIVFGEKVPVVDGNVYRVLARIFGIRTPVGDTRAKKEFASTMLSLMQSHPPGKFNEAVMEFGALQCSPFSPDCSQCPLKKSCYAFQNGVVEELPVMKPKKKSKKRYIYYFVFRWNHHLVIRQRLQADIWRNLYDFPSMEFRQAQPFDTVMQNLRILPVTFWKEEAVFKLFGKTYKHQLTHLSITANFVEVSLQDKPVLKEEKALSLIHQTDLKKFPVSRLVDRFLNDWEL